MSRVRTTITNSVLTLILCLLIMATVLVVNDAQTVQAETAVQTNDVVYLQLTDAPPVRDISQQRMAPLE